MAISAYRYQALARQIEVGQVRLDIDLVREAQLLIATLRMQPILDPQISNTSMSSESLKKSL